MPGADGAAQLTALRAWLVSDSALRGRVDWVRRRTGTGC
ncbi:effector-associated constant component EACC1 [Streptomyces sp. DW26H14]